MINPFLSNEFYLALTVLSSPSCGIYHGDSYVVSASRIAVDTLSEIPAVAAQNPTISNTKPLCRVVGQIPYGENNTLNFEVWLPEAESYNERYLSVGMCCSFVSGFRCG
jgi:hypothetical protein